MLAGIICVAIAPGTFENYAKFGDPEEDSEAGDPKE